MKLTNIPHLFFRSGLWQNYKKHVESLNRETYNLQTKNMVYWQDQLYLQVILYALPLAFIVLIPTVIAEYANGHFYIILIDLVSLLSVTLVTLSHRVNFLFQKMFVAVMVAILAILLIAVLGSFEMGSIYLLSVSVFVALLFSQKLAYGTVLANTIIYIVFASIIRFRLFDIPLLAKYSFVTWCAYAINFLFLDLILVMLIRYVLTGLENTIIHESELFQQVQAQVYEKTQRNIQLQESEAHYKSLFFQNPLPMCIYDLDSLQFIQVNDAAVSRYGYSAIEFTGLTTGRLHIEDQKSAVISPIGEIKNSSRNIQLHFPKTKKPFFADVKYSIIPFNGKDAGLIIVQDINATIEHTKAIEKQNEKLKKIAYLQSHVVRLPHARIMGLIDLLMQDADAVPDKQTLVYLDASAKELDVIIRNIVNLSEEINPL